MQNAFGQEITGFPFDKAHKFASEERVVMDKLMGVKSGVVPDVMDEGKVTATGLVAHVGRVLIFAKGAWFRIDQPIDIPIQPGSTGTIVARIDLSQSNSSVGNIDDGSYQYLLNQVSFKAITTTPVKEDILVAGVIYDVVLATFTSTTTTVTITDKREYCKQYNATGVMDFIGECHAQFAEHIVNQTQPVTNGNKPAAFADNGATSIQEPYKDCIRQDKIVNDAFLIFDNGGIKADNNTGKVIIVHITGYSQANIKTGTTEMGGNIRTLVRRKNSISDAWSDWVTGLDSQWGATRPAYNWSPMRPHIYAIKPGQAMGITISGRANSLPSGTSYGLQANLQCRVYITEEYTGRTGLWS